MSTKGSKKSGRRPVPASRDEGGFAALGSAMRDWLPVIVGLVVVVGAGLWFSGLIPAGTGSSSEGTVSDASDASSSSQSLPSFITNSPGDVQQAYTFVAAHPDETQYIPCYCGCGEHSGHRWIRDCFVKDYTASGITYDEHGSGCDICVNIALALKDGLAKGQSLATIRKTVDNMYSSVGPPTDTPLPPA
jgi:hypothetical protein